MMLADTMLMGAALDLGGYISPLKLLPVVALLFLWARLMTWIDKDAVVAHLPREWVNTGLFITGLIGFALFLLLPNFWLALGVLAFILAASFGAYLGLRHQQVGLADLKTEVGGMVSGLTKREKKARSVAGEVQILSRGAPLPVPDADDPNRAGYDAAQTFITDPLRKNAERIEVRPAQGEAAIQYVVDSVLYSAPGMEKADAAAGISYLKLTAGMDVEDRRKPQSGLIKAALDGRRYELEIVTAGTTAGESMRITVDPKKRFDHTIDNLGLTPEQLHLLQGSIANNRGVVLVAAPRGQGLTTAFYAILRAHDAFLTHIQTIEREPRVDLEGITQNQLPPGATPADEYKQVEWVCSQQPDTLMVDEISHPGSARELARLAMEGRRAYIGMRTASAFDAVMLWRKLMGDDQLAAQSLNMVIAGRVFRRLCMACKVGYAPDPETLRKLNMDPARVDKLFQARTQPLQDQRGRPIPCEFCHDLRYKGRFGVYETLVVDEEIRKAIAAGGSTNQLKNIFRKQRGRYLQEMALAEVEAGETSVQEVLRVLRSSEPAAAAPGASSAAAAAQARASAQGQPQQ